MVVSKARVWGRMPAASHMRAGVVRRRWQMMLSAPASQGLDLEVAKSMRSEERGLAGQRKG